MLHISVNIIESHSRIEMSLWLSAVWLQDVDPSKPCFRIPECRLPQAKLRCALPHWRTTRNCSNYFSPFICKIVRRQRTVRKQELVLTIYNSCS